MNKATFHDSQNIVWERVSKKEAERLYNAGKELVFCPCKMYPFGVWQVGCNITPSADTFESRVNAFEYYNCNSETGNYTSFYVARTLAA